MGALPLPLPRYLAALFRYAARVKGHGALDAQRS